MYDLLFVCCLKLKELNKYMYLSREDFKTREPHHHHVKKNPVYAEIQKQIRDKIKVIEE